MNDNPLRQYFRRPSIYIKLPSLYKHYDHETINIPESNELPVYPMTAIDEITSKTPDALYNGTAVVDIIKSCIPAIINPWKINNIDLETILLAIRIASNGEEMDVNSVCPSCSNEAKYGINLLEVMSKKSDIDYNQVLKIRDLEIKFKPLTYYESNKNNLSQHEIQKVLSILETYVDEQEKISKIQESLKKLFYVTIDIITSTIDYIKTSESVVHDKDHIKDFLLNCDKKTNAAIKDFSVKLKSKNESKPLKIKCVNCNHEYQQSLVLNITDFFE